MDKSRISIREKQDKIQLKIEKRKHSAWQTIEKTDDPKKVNAYIKELEKEIISLKLENNNLYGNINNNTTLTIYNYSTIKDSELLRPIINRRRKLHKQLQKRKKLLLKSLLLLLGGASALGINSYQKYQEKIRTEEENDMDELKKQEVQEEKIKTLQKEILDIMQKAEEKEKNFISSLPTIGTNKSDARLFYTQEQYHESIQKYATITGIDEAIIECIIAQEAGIGVSLEKNSGGAIGPAQIQYNHHIGQNRSLYNIITGEKETFKVTDEMLSSIDGNIKVCVAIFQDQLIRYKGNVFIAIQAYNFGQGAMNEVLELAARETPYTKDELINDPYILAWIEQVEEYSKQKEKETGKPYGDSKYLYKILSLYYKDELITKYQSLIYQNAPLINANNEVINVNQKEKSTI